MEQVSPSTEPFVAQKFVLSEGQDIGEKASQEDRFFWTESLEHYPNISFFGVFDGHGGKETSEWCKENFHKIIDQVLQKRNDPDPLNEEAIIEAFITADKTYINNQPVVILNGDDVAEYIGTTVCTVLLDRERGKLLVANLGDTRCIMRRDKWAVQLSVDHKTTVKEEVERIERTGHRLERGRIDGIINVSRSIGDAAFKRDKGKDISEQPIIPIPTVNVISLEKGRDEYIVIGTDGIYDGLENGEIIDFIEEKRKEKSFNVKDLASDLIKKGLEIGCYDNITVIIVFLE